MPPTAHANLGASKAKRWINCPGSVALEAGMPDQKSRYAAEGTAAHDLGERALEKGLDCDTWLGAVLEGFEVTEEMVEAVQKYVDHVNSLRGPHHVMLLEHKFDLSPLNPPGPMFGTSDCTIWHPDTQHLDVVDYKHGAGVTVSADKNEQLMYYALGAVVDLRKKPKTIAVTIVQPRGFHPDGIVRRYAFSWEDLQAFKRDLFAAAERTNDPDAPLAVGDWCRFCKAQATCPQQHATAMEVAQTEFTAEVSPPAPETLTPEQIGGVLAQAGNIRAWLRSIEEYVSDQINRGEEVPGWKLIPKRANRKWRDTDVVAKALDDLDIPEEDRYAPRKLRSPAQIEKAIKALYPVGSRPKLDEDLWEKKSSGSKLVPAENPTPALPAEAAVEFDALSNPDTTDNE